jgi:hypothetical protein
MDFPTDTRRYYDQLKKASRQDLMKQWTRISKKDYWYMLEAVPPIRNDFPAFAVGEAITTGVAGTLYDVCTKVGRYYYMRPCPLVDFIPSRFAKEIKDQLEAEKPNPDPIQSLTCCCCYGPAQGRQWHNRDTGFGLCPKCAAWIATKESPAQMLQSYGKPGYNYFTNPKP